MSPSHLRGDAAPRRVKTRGPKRDGAGRARARQPLAGNGHPRERNQPSVAIVALLDFGVVAKHFPGFMLIAGLCGLPLACGASDPSPSSNSGAGAPSAGSAGSAAGAPSSGGASAAGSNNGGAGGASAGASAGGASGASGASGGPGGGGAGGGGAGAGGSAGGVAACTPGSGTMQVGTSSVLDRKTCLTWTKTHAAMSMTNKQAATYCASLEQDGIGDWRVPHPEELVTWPDLATDSTAYITGPVYIPNAGTEQDGCTGNSHSCNIAKYNDNSVTCAWQGVGFTGWVECVSGTPAAGTAPAAYSAASCSPCNGEQSMFKETDCSAYTN